MIDRKKTTVKDLQSLCGYLNFLNKVIFPGRVFTCRMYSKYAQITGNTEAKKLKQHHHVKLDKEFKSDCAVWLSFLDDATNINCVVNRPMVDLSLAVLAEQLLFF